MQRHSGGWWVNCQLEALASTAPSVKLVLDHSILIAFAESPFFSYVFIASHFSFFSLGSLTGTISTVSFLSVFLSCLSLAYKLSHNTVATFIYNEAEPDSHGCPAAHQVLGLRQLHPGE